MRHLALCLLACGLAAADLDRTRSLAQVDGSDPTLIAKQTGLPAEADDPKPDLSAEISAPDAGMARMPRAGAS